MGRYPTGKKSPCARRPGGACSRWAILAIVLWIVLVIWIFRLIPLPDQSAAYPAKLTDLLAALTIVAVLIERVLETLFRIVEGTWRTAVTYAACLAKVQTIRRARITISVCAICWQRKSSRNLWPLRPIRRSAAP